MLYIETPLTFWRLMLRFRLKALDNNTGKVSWGDCLRHKKGSAHIYSFDAPGVLRMILYLCLGTRNHFMESPASCQYGLYSSKSRAVSR
jgi:hypothetical protein